MAVLLKTIVLIGVLLDHVAANPKVVPMRFRAHEKRAERLSKLSAIPVNLANAVIGYYVNVTVGTPPQQVSLQLDTGSSDTWMFAPQACAKNPQTCNRGAYNPSLSSSASLLAEDKFEIHFQTVNSSVFGDYIKDDFSVGGVTVKNLTLAAADIAWSVPSGILGIGPNSSEASVIEGYRPYPNIVDEMLRQDLIKARAFSLYLDDLNDEAGTLLFGGYDRAKYHGNLMRLPLVPDSRNGLRNTFSVSWTSLSITNASETVSLTPAHFSQTVSFDTGTTVTLLPPDVFDTVARYLGAVYADPDIWVLPCNVASLPGTIDFGFGPGVSLSVPFDEVVLPPRRENGEPPTSADDVPTMPDGSPACQFGFWPHSGARGDAMLFGDTFLRSQYVVYDLDDSAIYVAPTRFNATDSQVLEIRKDEDYNAAKAGAIVAPDIAIAPLIARGHATAEVGAGAGPVPGPQATTSRMLLPMGSAAALSNSNKGCGCTSAAPAMDRGHATVWLVGITAAVTVAGGALVAGW